MLLPTKKTTNVATMRYFGALVGIAKAWEELGEQVYDYTVKFDHVDMEPFYLDPCPWFSPYPCHCIESR
jgi:hypothetical protein